MQVPSLASQPEVFAVRTLPGLIFDPAAAQHPSTARTSLCDPHCAKASFIIAPSLQVSGLEKQVAKTLLIPTLCWVLAGQQRRSVMAACRGEAARAIVYCLSSQEACLKAQDMSSGLITRVAFLCYLAAAKMKASC